MARRPQPLPRTAAPRLTLRLEGVEEAMTIALDAPRAPISIQRVLDLARAGAYDGRQVYRSGPDTWQFGCWLDNGLSTAVDRENWPRPGDRWPCIEGEFGDVFDRGAVGLCRGVLTSSGWGELFICRQRCRGLDGRYALVGHVIAGLPDPGPSRGWPPKHPTIVESVRVEADAVRPAVALGNKWRGHGQAG